VGGWLVGSWLVGRLAPVWRGLRFGRVFLVLTARPRWNCQQNQDPAQLPQNIAAMAQ